MEKRTYIPPAIETMVLPQDALMDDIMQGIPGTGGGPGVGGHMPTWRPKNPTRTPVF